MSVTASIHGLIDNALPARGDNRKLVSEWLLSLMTHGAVEPSWGGQRRPGPLCGGPAGQGGLVDFVSLRFHRRRFDRNQ